jgi:proteasome lid subunit RPN8/RPN11
MSYFVAAGALIGLTVVVLLCRNRISSAQIRPAPAGVSSPDIVAESEEAEFQAVADEMRARRGATAELNIDELPIEPEITWEEAGRPFRPPNCSSADITARIQCACPTMERGKHMVLIARETFEIITAHLASNTSVELGGLLAGEPYFLPAQDAYCIIVTHAFAADGGNETAISFEYTARAWEALTPQLQSLPDGCVVVGSYHSHPGLGVFLSSTDLYTQADVFNQDWQIALVVDPIKEDVGFYISAKGVKADYVLLDALAPLL